MEKYASKWNFYVNKPASLAEVILPLIYWYFVIPFIKSLKYSCLGHLSQNNPELISRNYSKFNLQNIIFKVFYIIISGKLWQSSEKVCYCVKAIYNYYYYCLELCLNTLQFEIWVVQKLGFVYLLMFVYLLPIFK